MWPTCIMATSSMSVGMQLAVQRELERLMGVEGFPACTHAPFTSEAAWKVCAYPYHAKRVPPGGRAVLALLTINSRSLAVTVSPSLVVTKAHLPTIPQSLFRGSLFDGYLRRTDEDVRFYLSDCLAFKGSSNAALSYDQRCSGVGYLFHSIDSRSDDRAFLGIMTCVTSPIDLIPRRGTWILCPEELGFQPGKLQPDTYVVCMDDVKELLEVASDKKHGG